MSIDQGAPATDLRRSGAKGALYQGFAFIASKSGVMLSTIVLARILAPEQFGLVALAVVVVGYVQTLADAGVGQALVFLPARQSIVSAAILCALGTGTILMVVGLLAAPLVASFFGRPDLAPLVQLAAVSLIATALNSVPESLLRRELKFSRITVARAVSAVVIAATSITLAVLGAGAWSIIWGNFAGAVSYLVAGWIALPTKPSLRVWRTSVSDLRQVLAYGLPVAGATFLARAIFDVDYLIVGKLLGADALAYYTLAFKLPELAILNVFFVITSVTFPLYTRAKDDFARLRRGYVFSFKVQSVYGVTAGIGLAVVAPAAIAVVFGEKWALAAAPLAALACYAAVRTVGGGANEVYKAIGRPGLSIGISLLRLVLLVPVLILATRWGIVGVAWAQVVMAAVFLVLMQFVATRVIGLPPIRLLSALVPALIAGAAVAVVAGLVTLLPLPAPVTLVVAVVAGAAAAVAALRLTQRRFLAELIGLFARRRAA